MLALALSLAGCTQDLPPGTAGDPWGLALTASEAGPTGCRLTYEQSGGEAAGNLYSVSNMPIVSSLLS